MAFEVPGRKIGHFRAGSDLSALQFRFCVAPNVSGVAVQQTVAGGRVTGVIQNKPKLNEAVEIMVDGQSKVVAGGVIAQGDPVMSDAAGRAVLAVAGATAGANTRVGYAETAASAAGQIITVNLAPFAGNL